MITALYRQQEAQWPQSGRHILAQFDEQSIIVYQAYRPAIGRFAAEHQYFGGEFKYTRMSWIKPNFLWMMYRSGWGTKPGQEVVLALRLKRAFFERVLEQAVASSYRQAVGFKTQEAWKQALRTSNVRLQWDPDHSPTGQKLERKAIQLGLRNEILKEYGRDAIIEIKDISEFVNEQRTHAKGGFDELLTPKEEIYSPKSDFACQNVGLVI